MKQDFVLNGSAGEDVVQNGTTPMDLFSGGWSDSKDVSQPASGDIAEIPVFLSIDKGSENPTVNLDLRRGSQSILSFDLDVIESGDFSVRFLLHFRQGGKASKVRAFATVVGPGFYRTFKGVWIDFDGLVDEDFELWCLADESDCETSLVSACVLYP